MSVKRTLYCSVYFRIKYRRSYTFWPSFILSNEGILAKQMGSLEGRAVLQLEDETLADSKHNDRRTSSMDAAPQISVFDTDTDDVSCKCTWKSILRQIHIVLFSKKLNLLIPCGPLAMLVDMLTDHHVSCKTISSPVSSFLKRA